MGQYYSAIVYNQNGDVRRLNPDCGLKLMEHSWFKNPYVHAVCSYIAQQCVIEGPQRLFWVGDYAHSDPIEGEEYDINEDVQNPDLLKMGIGEEEIKQLTHESTIEEDPRIDVDYADLELKEQPKYIINLTKRVYIDLEHYYSCNVDEEDDANVSTWVPHPIPLLTAMGNGRGGGDYHGTDMRYIGTWAGDMLLATNNKDMIDMDSSLEEFIPHFSEGKEVQ